MQHKIGEKVGTWGLRRALRVATRFIPPPLKWPVAAGMAVLKAAADSVADTPKLERVRGPLAVATDVGSDTFPLPLGTRKVSAAFLRRLQRTRAGTYVVGRLRSGLGATERKPGVGDGSGIA